MALADSVCQQIINGTCDRSLQGNVMTLSGSLKLYGQQLETIYKGKSYATFSTSFVIAQFYFSLTLFVIFLIDQLDRLFVTFRNGSRDEKLDYVSRLHLLELVELRGTNWAGCDTMSDYYHRHKLAHSHSHEV
jgi:hypothetical protein